MNIIIMRTFAAMVAFLCVVVVPCSTTIADTQKEQLEEGQTALEREKRNAMLTNEEDYAQIITNATRAIELDPKSTKSYSNRGRSYGAIGKFDEAIQDYKRAIELDPHCTEYYLRLAGLYYARGDFDNAIGYFTEATRLDPRSSLAYRCRGMAYFAKRQISQAISDLTKAISIDPRDSTAYCNRSAMYLATKEYDLAITDANDAIRLNPTDAIAYSNRSGGYGGKGDYNRSIADATQAIELDPNYTTAYSNRGRTYGAIGKFDEAIQDYNRAIRLDPKCTEYYMLLAGVYDAKGDCDKALDNTNEAVRLSPQSAEVFWQRGAILASKGKVDQAIEDLTLAISHDPNNATIYLSRGDVYIRQQKYEKAIADYDIAVRLSPHSPYCYERRGALLIERGDYDRGSADIETAICLNPKDTAGTFEDSPKLPLSEATIEHGKRQVSQMLQDRPAMRQCGEQAQVLYEWATRKFAGEDVGRKIFWDASEPPANSAAANDPFPIEQPGAIMIRRKSSAGADKGKEFSFEELWCHAVYELYNVTNAEEFLRLGQMAAENRLSKWEFVSGMVECESSAADKTRAFYIHIFLPWAKEHRLSSHPTLWFLAWRSDPKNNLLLGHFTEKDAYWRYYERCYDLIILDSLARKDENQKALDLATEMHEQVETAEERVVICRYSGHCLLRLNRPLTAIDAYNEVLRFDPKDVYAYLGRATAYRIMNNKDRAMADYAEAIRLKPSNPEAYMLRGKAYEALGDKERASEDYATAKQLTELWGPGLQETTKEKGVELPGSIPSLERGWNKWEKLLLER